MSAGTVSVGGNAEATRARVFISYSRRDLAVAERVRDSMAEVGFEVLIDIAEIGPGEPWKDRLTALISQSEKVLFLISPESVNSEVCAWEIDEAESQAKAIIPIVVRATDDAEIPGRLRRLNFVFMDNETTLDASVSVLKAALSTDLAWEREKTRINELAETWDQKGRPFHRLTFSKQALLELERWRDGHPATAPSPSQTQLEFISACRRTHSRRQLLGTFFASALAVVLGLVALYSYDLSISARVNDVRATLNGDETEVAMNKFIDLASSPLIGLWANGTDLRGISSDILDTSVVVDVKNDAYFDELISAQASHRDFQLKRELSCDSGGETCLAYYLRDARGSETSYFIVARTDFLELYKSGGSTAFSYPKNAERFFSPLVSKNAFAMSDDGTVVAVSENNILRFWHVADIQNQHHQPFRTVKLGFEPAIAGFEPGGWSLFVRGADGSASVQRRIVSVYPRIPFGTWTGSYTVSERPHHETTVGGGAVTSNGHADTRVTYDENRGELSLPRTGNSLQVKIEIAHEKLRELLARAGDLETSRVYPVHSRLVAITLDGSECETSGAGELQGHFISEARPADLLLLHLSADRSTVVGASVMVCGPTQLETFGDFHLLAVSRSIPNEQDSRWFLAGRISAGFYEIGSDGRPLRLFGLCGGVRVIYPTETRSSDEFLSYTSFPMANVCDVASTVYFHKDRDLLTYFARSYNSPSGDRKIRALSLGELVTFEYENNTANYFDDVIDLSVSSDGRYILSNKEYFGHELFDVNSHQKFHIPRNMSEAEFDIDWLRVTISGQKKTIYIPERSGSQFYHLTDVLNSTDETDSYEVSEYRQRMYFLSSLSEFLDGIREYSIGNITRVLGAADVTIQKLTRLNSENKQVTDRLLSEFDSKMGVALLQYVDTPQFEEAEERFRSALELEPASADEIKFRWAAALLHVSQRALGTSERNPQPQTFSAQSVAYVRPLLEQALEHAEDNTAATAIAASAHFWLGQLALSANQFERAGWSLDRAAKLKNSYAAHWLWVARFEHAKTLLSLAPAEALETAIRTYLTFDSNYRPNVNETRFYFDFDVPARALGQLARQSRSAAPQSGDFAECDLLAASPEDPFSVGEPRSFADLVHEDIIKACTEAIASGDVTGSTRARYLFQRARGYVRGSLLARTRGNLELAIEYIQSGIADLRASSNEGYPISTLALGRVLGSGLVEKPDFVEAMKLFAKGLNETIRCCIVDVVKNKGNFDKLSAGVRLALLRWAYLLGSNDANELLRQIGESLDRSHLGSADLDTGPYWMFLSCEPPKCRRDEANASFPLDFSFAARDNPF